MFKYYVLENEKWKDGDNFWWQFAISVLLVRVAVDFYMSCFFDALFDCDS